MDGEMLAGFIVGRLKNVTNGGSRDPLFIYSQEDGRRVNE